MSRLSFDTISNFFIQIFEGEIFKDKQRLGMGNKVITKKRRSNSKLKKNNVKRKKYGKQVAFGTGIVRKVFNTLRALGGNE